MKIGFATKDWAVGALDENGYPTLGGSGHARIGIPAKALAQRGHEVVVGTLIGDRARAKLGVKTWDGRALGGFDVIVMQRWMFGDLISDIKNARAAGQVIVNDIDDYFWGLDPRNHAYLATDPRIHSEENRRHYAGVLRASDLVTVSTPFLADKLRAMGVKNVALIRNALDLARWKPHDVDREPATVGWVGALPWRSGDLEELRGIVDPFLLENPGLRFHHSGTHGKLRAVDALGLSRPARSVVSTQPMAPIDEYPKLWEPLDFTVIPLSDQPFNHAKSAIKGMEAAAAGVPFIASPMPEYLRLERAGLGRTAKRHRDWMRELRRLLDPEARTIEAQRNRAALAPYDIAHRAIEWEQAYESLMG